MPAVVYHLAHFNLAVARAALDHPSMADFVARLAPLNQLARASPGFVWMPEGEEAGSASAVFGDERLLPNLSVWTGVDELQRFVYEGLHLAALDRRSDWFEAPHGPAYVLWWVPAGHRPPLIEAKHRLEHLRLSGPAPDAFTFKVPFQPPEVFPS